MIWDENKHPRDERGRFAATISFGESKSDKGGDSNYNQAEDSNHNPDTKYKHCPGKIAGVSKGEPMDFEKADSGNVNPYYKKGFVGYETNCQTCVATYFARRLGYDVRALPNFANQTINTLSYYPEIAYIDENGYYPRFNDCKWFETPMDFLNRIVKDGEIHMLQFCFVNENYGHVIVAEKNKSGVLKLYDPQKDESHTDSDILLYLNEKDRFKTINLTKCKINEKIADSIMKAK